MPKRLTTKEKIERLQQEVKEVLHANFNHYASKLHDLIKDFEKDKE